MASLRNIAKKEATVKDIISKLQKSTTIILFQYRGLTVPDLNELRKQLKPSATELKIIKNTLLARALTELKIDLTEFLTGPNAILFGSDLLEPIKVISNFAQNHDALKIQVGVINGKKTDLKTINEYATIPSQDGLLSMLARGMMQRVTELAMSLKLYVAKLENKKG